jgi:hypothetical protein
MTCEPCPERGSGSHRGIAARSAAFPPPIPARSRRTRGVTTCDTKPMIPFSKSFMRRSLSPAVQWIGCAVFIALISYLSVLFVRWWESFTKLWDTRINYVRVHLVAIAQTAYHSTQVKVLNTHHGIQVEVLYAHHRWLILNETLLIVFLGLLLVALGLLLVALGLLRVAAAIRRHTRAPERTDAWEHKRHRDIMLAYEQERRQERVDRSLRSRAAFRAGAGAGSRHTMHGTRTRLIPPPCPENQTSSSLRHAA